MVNCSAYDYYDYYNYSYDIPEDILLAFAGGMILVGLITMVFGLLCYIFMAAGLHRMANRRGIRNGWLAWLPFGDVWVLGSISDQYQYVAKGRVRNRRKVLLGLEIAMILATVFIGIGEVFLFGGAMMKVPEIALIAALLVLFLAVAVTVLTVIFVVFEYIALYDLFNSSNPDNSVALLVLSIFLSFLLPFFVFASRNKELGMPPRKPVAPVPNTWQPPAPTPVPGWKPPVAPVQQTLPAEPAVEPIVEPAAEQPAAEDRTEE